MKLKLGGPKPLASAPSPSAPSQAQVQAQDGQAPTSPAAAAPQEQAQPNKIVKLKFSGGASVPTAPSPAAVERAAAAAAGTASASAKKMTIQRRKTTDGVKKGGNGTKRVADEDISPAAKRPQNNGAAGARRPSLIIKPSASIKIGSTGTPLSAGGGPRLTLKRKQSVAPKLTGLFATKGRPPPKRKPGEGYDSEDSEVEADPAEQKGFVLRMQPGEDADYLREAIANNKVGELKEHGGADVTMRFLTSDYRRAIVKVRGRMYAGVLVDLPCIVESMKSWDKKGWWKVSDICQMLLVLGPCKSDEEAKMYQLPREVDKMSMQYAHGLTPPMHWVRKRRFRKRASYKTRLNVEEEVQKLMDEDELIEKAGGTVEMTDHDPTQVDIGYESEQQYRDDEADADGEAVETVEGDFTDYFDQEEDGIDLEADLAAAFGEEEPTATELITESPAPMAEHASSFAAAGSSVTAAEESQAPTPAANPAATQDSQESSEEESDYDEDDEDEADSPDVVDEDALARAAEKAQQLEEVADLEREIDNVRVKAQNMSNQLLRGRELSKLKGLEEDLRMKREVFGLNVED